MPPEVWLYYSIITIELTVGIGASIAQIFLTQNDSNKLVAIARSADSLQELVKQYGASRVAVVIGDVTSPETSERAVQLALKFGSIDSIVANAGVLDPVDPVENANVAKWKELFDINLFSVVDLVQQALPHLKKAHGRFVAVLSGASTKAYHGWGAYGASKAALNHFVQSVSAENDDVSAISIAPGVVDTSMQQDIREKFGSHMTPESLQRFVDLHKNKDLLPPEVPANLYVNLATKGWSKALNGGYYRIDLAEMTEYK